MTTGVLSRRPVNDDYGSELLAGWMRRARPLRSGELLRSAGPNDRVLHVVRSGWLARFRLLADGRRQITALLLAGDHHHQRGDAAAAPYSFVALGACWVASIPAAEAEEARARCATLRAWLADGERRRCARLEEQLSSLGRRNALERTGHLLCELLVRSGCAGAPAQCDFPLTQTDLADVMGLSVVHTNRTLQALRKQSLAGIARGRLRVADLDALALASGFDASYLH